VSVLDRIVEATRHDVEERRRAIPQAQLEQELAKRGDDRPFAEALARPGLSLIAEYKRRSPSAGNLRADVVVTEVVEAYERGGAAAVSILTEPHYFGGSLDDLHEARAASGLPILRKDFVVDSYQLYESAATAADAVLLIVAALDDARLAALEACARDYGMDVLVEVHDAAELDRALALETPLIGINNRNLRTFHVSLQTTVDLLPRIPPERVVITESGILARRDVAQMRRHGVNAFLVGEAFMRAPDPGAALTALFGA
jgi:indole-3-glycerol phosphate synthase